MICSRCEQGEILEISINELNVKSFLCDECEAMWFNFEDIGKVPFVDFGTYMISKNLFTIFSITKQ